MNPTGNRQFDRVVSLAEANRQVAISVAGSNAAAARAADLSYLQTVVGAGAQFGVQTINEAQALVDLLNQPRPPT